MASSGLKRADMRRAMREIVAYGLGCGVLLAILKVVEYRFLLVDHSLEIFGGVIALLFAGVGIWLGRSLPRRRRAPVALEAAPSEVFRPDEASQRELGITPRELEILGLIASGLSNREIAEKLFVSENTVKTHTSRLLDKLGAKRRTQAVRHARSLGLVP